MAICKEIFLIFFWCNFFLKVSTLVYNFPEGFLFAASTSAYQVEGAWNVSGKGESIWDRFTHTHPNEIEDKKNGDTAADSYYKFREDSKILKDIGFHVYRFSISWSRILPNGDLSKINPAGIKHYNEMINDLCRKKIQPMVIIYHWDLPQKLEDAGGWLNSSIVDHMVNYADLLFYHFGDRVTWWITLNEPLNIIKGYSYGNTLAPSLNRGSPSDYIITHNMVLSHGRIYRLYDKKYRKLQKGKISITLDYEACIPKTKTILNERAVDRYFQFMVGIFAHPIYSEEGDYPKTVREIVEENGKKTNLKKSRLPKFTEEEKKVIKGTFDYFSLNHYTSYLCSHPVDETSSNNSMKLPFYQDMNVLVEQNVFWPKTPEPGMQVNPSGFRVAVKTVSKEYNYPIIFITENGYSDSSPKYDYKRIVFHQLYLQELLKAIYTDKCKVVGYTVWSLIDNFQWLTGYVSKFGMVHVNFNSSEKTRSRKISSYWMEDVIKSKKLPNLSNWLPQS